MKLEYIDNKLTIPTPTCNCTHHQSVDCDIFIGNGIINHLNTYIKNKISGKKLLLITDSNLFNLFGKTIITQLEKDYEVTLCVPKVNGKLKPNQYAIGEVMMALDGDTDFLVALGSGTVNDVTRYVAFNCNLPFASIGTSPSMDGYLSVVAPMLNDDLKINKPAKYPEVCIFDIDILKTSPLPMLFAGYGDVIGKYIAKADWILGNIINGERICPFCLEIMDEAISLCENHINDIKAKNNIGVQSLLEALLLTGLAMLLNGDSRPAASNEHNMGHFIEMKKLQQKMPHPSHGEAVGVATLYCLDVYKAFLNSDFTSFNTETIINNTVSPKEREALILEAYGNKIGASIIADNKEEPISINEHIYRVKQCINNIDLIKEKMSFLPTKESVINLYKVLDGPTNAAAINVDKQLLNSALLYAKDYRSRYNIFKLADECGILPQIIENTVQHEQK